MKTRSFFSRLLTFLLVLALPIGFGCSTGGGSQTSEVSWTGTVQTGTALFDEPAAVATDAGGNVYIAGGSSGDIDNCGCMSRMDGFVVKYGPSGGEEWIVELEQDAWIFARGIAVPPGKDYAYVTGETDADLTGTGLAPGRMDVFLYRIGPDGSKFLLAQEGTADDDYARAVAADADGNAYVAGDTLGSIDGNPNAGSRDAFVMKIDAGGNVVWAVQIGSADIDTAKGVALDAAGNAYVAGNTLGSLGAGGNAGRNDVFLAKVAPDNTVLWIQMIGTPLEDTAASVAVDASGNAFVAGTTGGRLGGVINAGSTDAFVAKFSPDGTLLWVRLLGTTETESGYAVTTDADGFVYIAGQTDGTLGASSSGLLDSFVACLAGGTGDTVWIRQFGTDRDDCAHAVVAGPDGDLFLAGDTFGGMVGNLNCGCCDLFVAKFDRDGNEY
jgi:hypothetical protein